MHSRFAKAHLRTHTQRAVYFTLVAQIADSWSAAEIATLKHLDAGSVEAVLDHYVAAGVVDLLQTEAGNRYRWRSDMAYLVEDEARVATTLDPVCGMTVTAGTPYWLAEASGELWLFCSELCLATFRAKPRIHRPPATTPSPQTTARDPIVRPGTLPACERQLDIAVFLLGALTPAEERDLISHATTCPSCQASLSELGDLPDLLARVPPAIAESINLQTGR